MKLCLRSIGFIAFFGVFLTGCQEQEIKKETGISPFIKSSYRWDAVELYMREIRLDSSHPNFYEPALDSAALDEIMMYFQYILDLKIPQSDSVFNKLGIHAFIYNNTNTLALEVDPLAVDVNNLLNGVRPTGNAQLDLLLETYPIEAVDKFTNYPEPPIILLHTSLDYNLIPVAFEYYNLTSVSYATPFDQLSFIEVDDISMKRYADSVNFSFYHDDLSRTYRFQIRDDSAFYLGTY